VAESIQTTNLGPLVSLTTTESANTRPLFHVPSGASMVVAGNSAFTGSVGFSGAVSFGANGQSFVQLRKSTVSVALGTVAFDSVTTSVTIANINVGDPVLAIVPASIWSGAYRDISLSGLASAGSTLLLGAVNSTLTGINTAAMNMDVFWLDLAAD
jgi:hypothetical protein